MQVVKLEHFTRAAEEIGKHGDNDTLPFNMDNRFISEKATQLASIAFGYFERLNKSGKKAAANELNSLQIFNERLLTPTGAYGFRISTKIHPFWNIYLNGIAVAIAEANEANRSERAHSYRYSKDTVELFNRTKSWRAFKQSTLDEPLLEMENTVVIQTDISSFYEHIYHHRIENCIDDLFGEGETVGTQIDCILSQLSSGRSFGLPVGGQCARVLAELLMTSIDSLLSQSGIIWHRYVDDFTLIAENQAKAYEALSILSNVLADYGLSLNRSKTTLLRAKHYKDFVTAQLFANDDQASKLKEIDLYFDPYTDDPQRDYEDLQQTVKDIDLQSLLAAETNKGQPDAYLVSQISRTLKLQSPMTALQLCRTLLSAQNLNAFRASWPTIMRGVISLRSDSEFESIHSMLDTCLDEIISHSKHLLLPETNCLHFLRAIRFKKSHVRSLFVANDVLSKTKYETIKRACIDCWRHWKDRPSFVSFRNSWSTQSVEVQRMFWLASYKFGDDGIHFRKQVDKTTDSSWGLGVETKGNVSFGTLFKKWAESCDS
jgi:hypothetical protein